VLFANYLIGLREGLEATLVVSILVAFLVKSGQRSRILPVGLGVALAVILSLGMGALLSYTSTTLLQSFESKEFFGGAMSIGAVAFVTWMIFWMRRTARALKGELQGKLGDAMASGPIAVAVVAFLAVAREGIETTLIFWASVQGSSSTALPLLGISLGIATAVFLGWLLYRSAVHINLARFFTWTGAGLILVAAGILAYGFHDLQEAQFLPGLNTLAFDVSRWIDPSSWYGVLLKGIFNFSPRTTVLEATVWLGYLVTVLLFFLWPSKPSVSIRSGPAAERVSV
jgi:high-affinity iron transporter